MDEDKRKPARRTRSSTLILSLGDFIVPPI